MSYWFFATCVFVGISASSTMGPIFVMTFNNSAIRGFLKGFFTALGAALGDGLLIFLGLVGTLALLQQLPAYRVIIDLVGGLLLLLYGIKLLLHHETADSNVPVSANTLVLTAGKAFLATVANPLTILFFMFAGAQILPSGSKAITTYELFIGSALTTLGSLMILSAVAYIASSVGRVMRTDRLKLISTITACVVLTVGGYFLFDAIRVVIAWLAGQQ